MKERIRASVEEQDGRKLVLFSAVSCLFVNISGSLRGGGGGGGFRNQAYHSGKQDFELGVGGEGQDTSQNFEGSFGCKRAILPL